MAIVPIVAGSQGCARESAQGEHEEAEDGADDQRAEDRREDAEEAGEREGDGLGGVESVHRGERREAERDGLFGDAEEDGDADRGQRGDRGGASEARARVAAGEVEGLGIRGGEAGDGQEDHAEVQADVADDVDGLIGDEGLPGDRRVVFEERQLPARGHADQRNDRQRQRPAQRALPREALAAQGDDEAGHDEREDGQDAERCAAA